MIFSHNDSCALQQSGYTASQQVQYQVNRNESIAEVPIVNKSVNVWLSVYVPMR